MFRGLSKDVVPVLYQIHNLREDGFYYFKLDNADYSLFPNEQEALLIPGHKFKIIEISEQKKENKAKYYQIKLK